jgi:hypothetical protein
MNPIDGVVGVIEPKAAIESDRKALGLRVSMPLECLRNPNCPTTCRHHMPHVVVYVVAYVVPACWRRHGWCTAIPEMSALPRFKIASGAGPKSQNNSKNCQARPFIVSIAHHRALFELAPGTLPVEHFFVENRRTLFAARWKGRARRAAFRCGSVSLVRIHWCRLVPPDLCGFPDASPGRDEGGDPRQKPPRRALLWIAGK